MFGNKKITGFKQVDNGFADHVQEITYESFGNHVLSAEAVAELNGDWTAPTDKEN